MTREFEDWLFCNRERLCDEAIGLFNDSVKCLKNNIDRPAYLLAYQGMMVTLREILKSGHAPKGYTEGEWTNTLTKIAKEDSWDAAVYDIVKKGPTVSGRSIVKDAPLHMPDGIRSQFDFWRNLRNICAHYKREPFIKAHVLTLYAFITAHLMLISVSGGLELMLDKLRRYCDPTITPDNADISPLLDEVISRVDVGDLGTFMKEAAKIINKSPRKDFIDFLDTILKQDGVKYEPLKQTVLSLIEKNEILKLRLVELNPEYVLQLYTTREQIYVFLHKDIYRLRMNGLTVLSLLLVAGKIEDSTKDELFSAIQADMYKSNRWTSFDDTVLSTLILNGYFNVFVKDYLGSDLINDISQMGVICHRTDFYISHMRVMPLNENVVNQLIDVLGSGKSCPYTLADRFKNELIKDTTFFTKLKEVADKNSITLPDNWTPK